jgi:hypothetical protein
MVGCIPEKNGISEKGREASSNSQKIQKKTVYLTNAMIMTVD